MKNGQNNKGYKNPDTRQWGVRTFWTGRGPVWTVQWHSTNAKLNNYLKAKDMTKQQAQVMCRVLARGGLGV